MKTIIKSKMKEVKGNTFAEQVEYLKSIGFIDTFINGSIGYGDKTHKLRIIYKENQNLMEVIYLSSICGSAKLTSGLRISEREFVTCKKCNLKKG